MVPSAEPGAGAGAAVGSDVVANHGLHLPLNHTVALAEGDTLTKGLTLRQSRDPCRSRADRQGRGHQHAAHVQPAAVGTGQVIAQATGVEAGVEGEALAGVGVGVGVGVQRAGARSQAWSLERLHEYVKWQQHTRTPNTHTREGSNAHQSFVVPSPPYEDDW